MRVELTQLCGYFGKGTFPGDGPVAIRCCLVTQRLNQPADVLEVMIRPGSELANRMVGKELRRRALAGCFPSHGFCAVLTVLERMRLPWIRPRATWTIEAAWLVHGQQCAIASDQGLLASEVGLDGIQRTPAAGRRIDDLFTFRGH